MRYIIGIDLGTTQSCVSYVDTQQLHLPIHQFRIPQLKDTHQVESFPTLPSFCYLHAAHEWPSGALQLPWKSAKNLFVGHFALSQGAKVPTRQVQSAKSWLSHAAARRRDKILPLEAAVEGQRISPVEASAAYLSHLKEAWNHLLAKGDPEAEFEQQEIFLTVPASFDEVARTLTVEAARQAGFLHLNLLEEPQAAFYSWIAQNEKESTRLLPSGSTILVVDVGGGTTDFSIIEVTQKEGALIFERKAVGEHVLLGGDSMDHALAHWLEGKLRKEGRSECSSAEWHLLCHAARQAKEHLLEGAESYRIHLQGTGSSVVAKSFGLEVQREELVDLLLEGFFKTCPWREALQMRKGSGLRNVGLPYAEEPSIIKQLAFFLARSGARPPTHVLFNGGALKPSIFQNAILEALQNWFPDYKPQTLSSVSLDLAVSRGAAYYGKARRGQGIQIGGGASRGYYLAIDQQGEHKALTLLPKGSVEGSVYEPAEVFWVQPNRAVEFRLFTSHVRLGDAQGDLIAINEEEFQALPPIKTLLRFGKGQADQKIPVRLHVQLTPLGTLEIALKAQNSAHEWKLEFQLRTVEGQENAFITPTQLDETFDKGSLLPAQTFLRSMFGGDSSLKPHKVMESLEELLGELRRSWSPSVLRGLWQTLLELAPERKKSQQLETRFWNLAGFLLRPGFGVALDDHRIKELWKLLLGESKAVCSDEVRLQQWICIRRIAGGLSRGQQQQLASELLPKILQKMGAQGDLNRYNEEIRVLGAFEFLEASLKIKLGQYLLQRLSAGGLSKAEIWTLGRLGARHLSQGALAQVVPAETICNWLEILKPGSLPDEHFFFILSLWGRKTAHREYNLSVGVLEKIVAAFPPSPPLERLKAHLFHESQLTQAEQEEIYGEILPLGISLEK